MKAIHHVLTVAASPEQIYGALSTLEGLTGWWTTRVSGDAQVGGVIHFTFDGEFDPEMKVTALEPGSRLTWESVGGPMNWDGSTFEFTLEQTLAGTLVRFWQRYGRPLADDAFGIYNYNWGYYLESLRLFCETGRGKPFEASEQARASGD